MIRRLSTRRTVARQLTASDADFLCLEGGFQSGNIALLVTVAPAPDGGTLTLEDVRARVAERLPDIPLFSWRLHRVALDLDHPYWVEATDVEVAFHVREMQLPPQSDNETVAVAVARETVRPMDRSRPLWEIHVMHGLPGGETGLLLKLHHSGADGESAVEIVRLLVDTPSRATSMPAVGAAVESSDIQLIGRGVVRCAQYLIRRLIDLGRRFNSGGPEAGKGARREEERVDPPTTSFNHLLTATRVFAFGRIPLVEVKKIRRRNGFTTNDVVVAIYTGAVRRWLLAHDELPSSPLITMLPHSTRRKEDRIAFGNRFGFSVAPFHTEETDPVQRLRLTHDSLQSAGETQQTLPGEHRSVPDEERAPPILARARKKVRPVAIMGRQNLIVSTVPGPPRPVWFAGAEVTGIFPCSLLFDGVGLNVTSIIYGGHAHFGMVADEAQVPDVWRVAGWIHESLDELDKLGSDPIAR
jgi:diacylglycerol O-acyltransferase / wax synthase